MALCVWCHSPMPSHRTLCRICHQALQPGGTLISLDAAAHPALAVDALVRVRAANSSACNLLQMNERDLLDQPLCKVLCPKSGIRALGSRAGCPGCPVHHLVLRTLEAKVPSASAMADPRIPPRRDTELPPWLITSVPFGTLVVLRVDILAETA